MAESRRNPSSEIVHKKQYPDAPSFVHIGAVGVLFVAILVFFADTRNSLTQSFFTYLACASTPPPPANVRTCLASPWLWEKGSCSSRSTKAGFGVRILLRFYATSTALRGGSDEAGPGGQKPKETKMLACGPQTVMGRTLCNHRKIRHARANKGRTLLAGPYASAREFDTYGQPGGGGLLARRYATTGKSNTQIQTPMAEHLGSYKQNGKGNKTCKPNLVYRCVSRILASNTVQ